MVARREAAAAGVADSYVRASAEVLEEVAEEAPEKLHAATSTAPSRSNVGRTAPG